MANIINPDGKQIVIKNVNASMKKETIECAKKAGLPLSDYAKRAIKAANTKSNQTIT